MNEKEIRPDSDVECLGSSLPILKLSVLFPAIPLAVLAQSYGNGFCTEFTGTCTIGHTSLLSHRLSEDKVKQCVDPKLNNDYPPKAIAKLAAVAALCVQYEADFRPNMTIVVKALQPLLNAKPIGPDTPA
ncbi:hypothetical protein COLO4_13357 [Corchorus olitorius]|uniref:Uncharacterized protein n=1 Tax=Corchorus olitorius TaxID=93759 RepID=A0A1R3JWZ8_9ROSI|nr:hypothetical protein COLO4_13357 [Corchorus olitorius]